MYILQSSVLFLGILKTNEDNLITYSRHVRNSLMVNAA